MQRKDLSKNGYEQIEYAQGDRESGFGQWKPRDSDGRGTGFFRARGASAGSADYPLKA
jgi:hypothetical protein